MITIFYESASIILLHLEKNYAILPFVVGTHERRNTAMNRVDAAISNLEHTINRIMNANRPATREEAQKAEAAIINALIHSREDAVCSDCNHKVSEHGPDGCEHEVERDKVYGDCEFARAVPVPCGCFAWTTEFDKEAHEGRYGK